MLIYDIDILQPLLVTNSGDDFIDFPSTSKTALTSSAIRYQLGERNTFLEPDELVRQTAATFDYSITIPALIDWQIDWQIKHNLDFTVRAWEVWMQDNHADLHRSGLLYTGLPVTEFTGFETATTLMEDKRSGSTVSFRELQQLSDHKRPSEVCSWLARQGIPYRLGARRRPLTTVKAINQALDVETLGHQKDAPSPYEPKTIKRP